MIGFLKTETMYSIKAALVTTPNADSEETLL